MPKKLRIEIEAATAEENDLLVAVNADWPRPIEVAINGHTFTTIRYERVDD